MIQLNTLKKFEDVKGYYYCDKEGNIWSKKNRGLRKLKTSKSSGGYSQVVLYTINNKPKICLVHIAICTAYHENPDNKPTVNHINHNIQDNRAENLEWATHTEQRNKHWRAKQIKTKGRKIMLKDSANCRVMVFQSVRQCEKYLGVSHGSIHHALKKGGKCKGFEIKKIKKI